MYKYVNIGLGTWLIGVLLRNICVPVSLETQNQAVIDFLSVRYNTKCVISKNV